MPQSTHDRDALVREMTLLGLITDYRTLSAPHVDKVRDVLHGRAHRYKVRFGDAMLVFHHGCLMVQVVHNGLIRALPPFSVDAEGRPWLSAMPEHQQHWMDEFLALPKGVLLFYFTLLKEVFRGYALGCRWTDPDNGRVSQVPVPDVLKDMLDEVGWRTR